MQEQNIEEQLKALKEELGEYADKMSNLAR